MFDAPEIIKRIPDIEQIYRINETQGDELDRCLEKLERNIFIETMDEETTQKWEKILGITPTASDSIEDRRMRVKLKLFNKSPYTYRVIQRAIRNLAENSQMILNKDRTEMEVVIHLDSQEQRSLLSEMLEEYLPLNIFFKTHNILENKAEFREKTCAITYGHSTAAIFEDMDGSNRVGLTQRHAVLETSEMISQDIKEDFNDTAECVRSNGKRITEFYVFENVTVHENMNSEALIEMKQGAATRTEISEIQQYISEDYNESNLSQTTTHAASATSEVYINSIK